MLKITPLLIDMFYLIIYKEAGRTGRYQYFLVWHNVDAVCRMLLSELMELASKEPSTSSKDEEPTEDSLSSSMSIQKGTLLDR